GAACSCGGDIAFGAARYCRTAVDQCRGAVLRECPVMDHVPATSGLAAGFRFRARRIGCSEAPQRGDQSDLCGYTLVDYRRPSRRATMSFVARGCSAVGSASPCQGEGRGFESRHPLEGAVASTPAVEWPSGEATACKAVHTGSIPVSTSKKDPARLAQRESASLTRKRSLVQSQYRAPSSTEVKAVSETQIGRCGPDMGQLIAE